jgi:hypothetical protein
MATSKATSEPTDESPYATTAEEAKGGKPVGPEHDGSFSAPDFYDPQTGKRIETDWDSEQQKADPGYDAEAMAGTVEKPAEQPTAKSTKASGGEGGETK